MARRYVRDNRGRFASVGATARGGRLRTAAGNKRATQTKEIASSKPAGTISRNRRAKPETPAPAPARLTPRQKARQLGALPQRQNEGPRRTTSIPRGTVGANTPVRNMARADRVLEQVKLENSSQMAVAQTFRGGGVSAPGSQQQLRRDLVGRSESASFRGSAVYKPYTPPSFAEFKKRQREELSERRRSHSPRKRK